MLGERGLQRIDTTEGRAYVLTGLVPPVAVDDEVVLNTTAVDLDLGTGGWHVVHWNLATRAWSGAGHIMKLRYTSLQADTGAAEEHVEDLPSALGGLPVVACTLHSQVGVVAAVLRHLRPRARIAYVMTDGAALPLATSDLVHDLRSAGVIDITITAGHACGDLEAVTVPSALAVARHVAGADVVVAGAVPVWSARARRSARRRWRPPGSSTRRLGSAGTPCSAPGCQRATSDRAHQGISHHTRTVMDPIHTRSRVLLPEEVPGVPDVAGVLDGLGVRITTMGRGPRTTRRSSQRGRGRHRGGRGLTFGVIACR